MKKIFALVLSLCMVLSSFVAVSAQEQVWNEGVWNEGVWNEGTQVMSKTYVNLTEDFEDGLGATLAGNSSLITVSTGTVEGRDGQVLILDSNDTAKSWQAIAGFALKDANGNQYIQSSYPLTGIVNYSFDVMVPDVSTISGPVCTLRGGDFPSSVSGPTITVNSGWGLESGVWKTISGTIDMSTKSWSAVHQTSKSNLTFRPNFTSTDGVMYIDNVVFTQAESKYVDYQVNLSEDFEDGQGIALVGNTGITGTTTTLNGRNVLQATASGSTTHNGLVAIKVVDANGEAVKVKELSGDATLNWSVDVMFTDVSAIGNGYAMLRDGGWTPSGDLANLTGNFSNLGFQNNVWKTIGGTVKLKDLSWSGSATGGSYFAIRPNFSKAGTMYVDNMSCVITTDVAAEDVVEPGWEVEEGWEVEPGWEAPNYTVATTAVKSSAYPFITESNGAFTFTTADVAANIASTAWSSQFCIMVIPETPIPVGKDFSLTYDLKTNGVLNSVGNAYTTMTVRARAVDNTTDIRQARTIGYIDGTATVNTEEANTVVFNSANMTAGGGTSTATEIAAICLVIDMQGACIRYNTEANDGSVTFSNIAIVENDAKVALSADKTANGVDLTLSNDNAQKYSFAGRLLIAEYKTVDGVKELVQFAEVAVDEEIEAGSDAVVTAEFEENITAGNQVYVFVWEPASFDAIKMFVK